MDRMIIVGPDGQDRILIEDNLVVDLTIRCSDFAATGAHHIHYLTGYVPECKTCGQSVGALKTRGEDVVL